MELSDFIRTVRRSWAVLLVAALIGGLVAGAYLVVQKPLYDAEATVVVTPSSGTTIDDSLTGASYAQQVVPTYADIATKPVVLDPVRTNLKLNLTAEKLADEVTITTSTTSTLIGIAVSDASATRAAAIANAIGAQLSKSVTSISPERDGTASVKITSIETATAADMPSFPNVPLTLLIGVVGGFALALAVQILRSVLDTRIRRPEDAQAVTDRPVLGGIARSSSLKRDSLVVHSEPDGRLAEEFRSLRTNLQFLDVDRALTSIVISSSVEREGKTTTAVNLALAMSDAGSEVLVIDADLRRPRLADALRVDGSIGLTDVLIGRVALDDALQHWGDRSLMVLPAGTVPPNPSELLQSDSMARLLVTLHERFSTVIIDAPPLLPVSDAAILSHRVAGTILVCAAGTTKKGQLRDAIEKVDRVGGHILGVVLTKLPVTGSDASSYVKYEYAARPGGATDRLDPKRITPETREI